MKFKKRHGKTEYIPRASGTAYECYDLPHEFGKARIGLTLAWDMNGNKIVATDGDVWDVSEVLFDDQTWMVHWAVVDCVNWLTDRKVLLPPAALGHFDLELSAFSVRMTRMQVRDSPDIDLGKSVTRQWKGTFIITTVGRPTGELASSSWRSLSRPLDECAFHRRSLEDDGDDPHLRSANAFEGYHLHAIAARSATWRLFAKKMRTGACDNLLSIIRTGCRASEC